MVSQYIACLIPVNRPICIGISVTIYMSPNIIAILTHSGMIIPKFCHSPHVSWSSDIKFPMIVVKIRGNKTILIILNTIYGILRGIIFSLNNIKDCSTLSRKFSFASSIIQN